MDLKSPSNLIQNSIKFNDNSNMNSPDTIQISSCLISGASKSSSGSNKRKKYNYEKKILEMDDNEQNLQKNQLFTLEDNQEEKLRKEMEKFDSIVIKNADTRKNKNKNIEKQKHKSNNGNKRVKSNFYF